MPHSALTRRSLAGMLAGAAGAALLDHPAARAAARPAVSRQRAHGFIRLSANENPYGPCARALEALKTSGSEASRYPFGVDEEVRDALARLHGVAPEQVVLGCGSSDVLRMAGSAFLPAGRTVVAAEPTFEAVLDYARVTRAEPFKVPLTADFRHDLSRMAAACDARTGLVYVCNPNNPTGTIVGGDDLEAFLPKVPGSAVVLVDEAYHHFVETPRYRSAFDFLARYPNLVIARTFSKIYGMAGMRLGYGVASKENAKALRDHASWDNTNEAVLAMAAASLSDSTVVPRQRKLLNDTRRWLCSELEKEGRRYIPSETNFLMIDVQGDVLPVIRAFRDRGIQVGRKFPSMGNWLRISIGKQEETAAFLAGLREIVPARAAA